MIGIVAAHTLEAFLQTNQHPLIFDLLKRDNIRIQIADDFGKVCQLDIDHTLRPVMLARDIVLILCAVFHRVKEVFDIVTGNFKLAGKEI